MCNIRWCDKNRSKLIKLVDQYRKEASADGSCAPTSDAFDMVSEMSVDTFGNKISCGAVQNLYYKFRRGDTSSTHKKREGVKKNNSIGASVQLKFDLLLAALSLSVPPGTKVDLFQEIMQL